MHRFVSVSIVSILFITQASLSFASGGYSGGGYNRPSGTDSGGSRGRAVDQNYEQGKSIYRGRKAGEPSFKYCILVDGEKVPIKRKSIKAYKNGTYNELATNMYQCDEPEKQIANGLTRDSLLYVLYYLNKRHKLNLKGA
jgi:hypothetical protein